MRRSMKIYIFEVMSYGVNIDPIKIYLYLYISIV